MGGRIFEVKPAGSGAAEAAAGLGRDDAVWSSAHAVEPRSSVGPACECEKVEDDDHGDHDSEDDQCTHFRDLLS
jgi:hypothetical protein